jgi:hypothetical protein
MTQPQSKLLRATRFCDPTISQGISALSACQHGQIANGQTVFHQIDPLRPAIRSCGPFRELRRSPAIAGDFMPKPESHPSKRPARMLGAYIVIAFIIAIIFAVVVVRDNQKGKADTTIAPSSGT